MSITLTTVILFAVFGVLLFLGVPISISIVVSSIVTAMSTLSWDQITFITMQKMNSGVESFSLLAVPLFILAGNIMNNGGIAKRLVNFAQLFVGKIPGSMAQANILGNMLFGALSGSSVAAASAVFYDVCPAYRADDWRYRYAGGLCGSRAVYISIAICRRAEKAAGVYATHDPLGGVPMRADSSFGWAA